MRSFITVNGKTYKSAELDFNNVCRLEDMGAPITQAEKCSMNLIRGYLALCMNGTKEIAGKELEAHIVGGGDMADIMDCMTEAIEESGFFQALSKSTETETRQVESKKK